MVGTTRPTICPCRDGTTFYSFIAYPNVPLLFSRRIVIDNISLPSRRTTGGSSWFSRPSRRKRSSWTHRTNRTHWSYRLYGSNGSQPSYRGQSRPYIGHRCCLLYTSDAADEED